MAEVNQTLKPEYVFYIIIKRRWIIMIPFCLVVMAGIIYTIRAPKIYQAETLILIEPQRVPANYVQSVVSMDIEEIVSTISQQILSRSNLEKIIKEFDLYSGAGYKNMFMEDKVAGMRNRVGVNVTNTQGGADTFSVSFKGKDPLKVMTVANALATYFIDENIKVRESQAIGTSEFLDAELENMRLKLERVEKSLKDFRKTHMGELPEQLDSNLRVLDRMQEQLIDRQQSLRDAKNRLIDLENQAKEGVASAPNGYQELEQLKAELVSLRSKYTSHHPDIIRLKDQIAQKEEELKLQAEASEGENSNDNMAPSKTTMDPDVVRMKKQISREIDTLTTEIAELQTEIANYQKRVEDTPKREQELLGLKRDYDNIQESYNSLLARRLEAEISVNMERKQKGEQFRILDTAKLPEKPVEPDMKKLFLIFIGAGLGLGGGIVFLLEYFNNSYRSPDEVEKELELPVLLTIPPVLQEKEIRWKRLNRVFSVVCLMYCLALFGGFGFLTIKGVDKTLLIIKKVLSYALVS
jgi:polysaccharide chain length determinant protein (PEP-CTERM system associated)